MFWLRTMTAHFCKGKWRYEPCRLPLTRRGRRLETFFLTAPVCIANRQISEFVTETLCDNCTLVQIKSCTRTLRSLEQYILHSCIFVALGLMWQPLLVWCSRLSTACFSVYAYTLTAAADRHPPKLYCAFVILPATFQFLDIASI